MMHQSVVPKRNLTSALKKSYMDDTNILLDLRKMNGHVKSDAFWDKLAAYIEELNPAVNE